jgi:hypothetical protein
MKSKLKADNEWWEGPSPGADFSADVSFGVPSGLMHRSNWQLHSITSSARASAGCFSPLGPLKVKSAFADVPWKGEGQFQGRGV